MYAPRISRCVLGFFPAVTMLAGCGVMQPPGAVPQTSVAASHSASGNSWILPEAKLKPLLYVINAQIKVFSFPLGKLIGSINDVNAGSVCGDKTGDIFVTDRAYTRVVEYPHGSLTPSAILRVYQPLACAVDPNTGNLAVTIETGHAGHRYAGVAIFTGAKGRPKFYYYSQNYNAWLRGCTYDSNSNLFVTTTVGATYGLTELPKSGATFKDIKIKGVSSPSGVQWDGKYLTVSQQTSSTGATIYRMTIKGSSASVVGKTNLDSVYLLGQTWFQGGIVVGASVNSGVSLWKYPTGGYPIRQLSSYIFSATGVAISL